MNKAPNVTGKAKEHSPTSHTFVIAIWGPSVLSFRAIQLHLR